MNLDYDSLPGEEWRPCLGFEGEYEVSNLGRVKSLPRTKLRKDGIPKSVRGRILKPGTVKSGHQLVAPNGVSRFIHRLVLEAFVGPRPEGLECCHNNGDPADNRLENLRWDTRQANSLDKVAHGGDHKANRTHCPYGHPYSGDNLSVYVRPNGRPSRVCRTCSRARYRRKRESENE